MAVQAFIDGLSATPFPGASKPAYYLDEAPFVDGSANQVQPPFIVISDNIEIPEWSAGTMKCIFRGTFDLAVYYQSLGDCDNAMLAIFYNGQDPRNRAGLAFCTLDLALPLFSMAFNCVPGQSNKGWSKYYDVDGNRVHYVKQRFATVVYQDPTYGS